MNYSDFQILSNEAYQIINEKYSSTSKPDRKSILFQICKELKTCSNFCFNLENKYNFKIRKSIELANSCIIKLYNNLQTTFNLYNNPNLSVENFNLFGFLKKLTNIISLFSSWNNLEAKEYYKSICEKSISDLLDVFQNILSSLEESDIRFYKHM